MADPAYKDYPYIFSSKGIVARVVDDTAARDEFLALTSAEELAENSLSQRLGTTIVNSNTAGTIGGAVFPLSASVVSLSKLAGLNGNAWRYAVTSDGKLWRRSGLTRGAYTQISSGLSGNPISSAVWRPELSSYPFNFFSDGSVMLKDNGSFSAPQNNGIFAPQFPVTAAVQPGDLITLDNYDGTRSYTYSGISPGSLVGYVNTTLTFHVSSPGLIYTVTVADPTQIGQFQLLTVDSGPQQEVVVVLAVTSTGFTAFFTKAHNVGTAITSAALSVTVPASTTGIINCAFGGTPITAWPTTLSLSDYIGLYVFCSDPTQIRSITLKFDCGDGSFNTDYFYKVIAQGPLQQLLATVNDPTTAATDALLSESLGLYGNSSSGVAQLQSGLSVWTPLLQQLSDFAGAGRADFNDPVFNWANVNGYQVQIVTNDTTSATVKLAALLLQGGSGPDTLGGIGYDYRFTFYNANDGTESNASVEMTSVNPPNNTSWVYPRRQPVQLTLRYGTPDPQSTDLRIYRRGGTLGDNWRRIDEIALVVSNQTYTDNYSDDAVSGNDILSLTNDVPVTSTLPVPVNTTLSGGVTGNPVAAQNVNVASTANMSANQIITIGTPGTTPDNFEEAIIFAVNSPTQILVVVQNNHSNGESVQATAKYGQPCSIMAQAYGQMYYAGDVNNPHYLYYSAGNNPQAVGSANFVEVGTPDDPITVILQLKGNLYVSTRKFWWAIAPGTTGKPTVYPTAAKHGCVAPQGYVVTEKGVYYQAMDGIRFFAGGASEYLTQNIEFIFQGVGSTPIVEADQTQLAKTVMAYWNMMIFVSYVGLDGKRHRLIMHSVYNRWRNDDLDAQSILLEADTNNLLFGDSNGYVHLDRQDQGYDEGVVSTLLAEVGIALNIESSFQNQGAPDVQKNYTELQLDVNTAGQTLTATLLFDDGEASQVIGTFSNTQRGKINFILNGGEGFTYYKAALQITGNVNSRVYIYQGAIKALALAKTRTSFDTYWLRDGYDDNKFAKDSFWEYTSTTAITVNLYHDGNLTTPVFSFTLPSSGGIRNSVRQRLPAIQYKMRRFVGTSTADFQIWGDETCIECKPVCTGKGYEKHPLMLN